MKEAVLEYIHILSPDSRARVAKHFASEVEEFATLVACSTQTLQSFHTRHRTYNDSDPKQAAFGLMTKGANTLMAGFELALAGYRWEPGILFRSSLEGFAVAWDLVHNKERYAQWKANNGFRSTESISNLKKEIEPVGKMYGFLSNMHVHTNPINSSPSMIVEGGEAKFQFFGLLRSGKEQVRRGEIYFGLFSAYVCLQLTELVFHDYSSALETLEKITGTDTVRNVVNQRHQPFVDAAMTHFRLMMTDPDSCLR